MSSSQRRSTSRLLLRSAPLSLCTIALACSSSTTDVSQGRLLQSRAAASPGGDTAAYDYLVEKVCVDANGVPQAIDPYACPTGSELRPMKNGESVYFHRDSQLLSSRRDSYVTLTPTGLPIIPQTWNNKGDTVLEGYGIYQVADGWASSRGTRDGNGFSQTFFGDGCVPGGWKFFPTTFAQNPSGSFDASNAINLVYWEQTGESWPGTCSGTYGYPTLTYELLSQFPFAGVAGNPVKNMDSIHSIYGYSTGDAWLQDGHLENFFFTRVYGLTRWDAWRPTAAQVQPSTTTYNENVIDAINTSKNCRGYPTTIVSQVNQNGNVVTGPVMTMTYKGVGFTATACADFSNITVDNSPTPTSWPVPDLNLLSNFHFDGFAPWKYKDVFYGLDTSTAPRDIAYGTGVSYLGTHCAADPCASDAAVYQDIPVTPALLGSSLTYAARARSRAASSSGVLALSLTQLDSSGAVISSASFEATVTDTNVTDSTQSIVLASTYVSSPAPVKLASNAATLRFSISPQTPGAFDIVDAWVIYQAPPQPLPPTGLTITAKSASSITVGWASGGSTTQAFWLAYQQGPVAPACNAGTSLAASETSYTITGLLPLTEYSVSLCAADALDDLSTQQTTLGTTGGVCTPGDTQGCCPFAQGCSCPGDQTCNANGKWGSCDGAGQAGHPCP